MNFLINHYRNQEITELPDVIKNELIDLDEKLMKYNWSQKLWSGLWSSPQNYSIFCLELDGLAGFSLWLEGEDLELLKIAIAPDHRGGGVALEFFNESLSSLGRDTVFLEVEIGNTAAIKFYEKLGFKTLNKVKRYYRDGSDCLKMALNIDFSHNN